MSSDSAHFDSENTEIRRYQALLEMTDLLVRETSVPELFLESAKKLRQVAQFEVASVCLYDPARNVMRLHLWEDNQLVSAPPELPVEDTACGWVWENQQPLDVPDVERESRFSGGLQVLKAKAIRSFCEIPLTTPLRRLGSLGLGSFQADAYNDEDLRFLPRVAELVAVAIENVQTREALREEKQRLQMLLEINTALVTRRDDHKLFPVLSGFIKRLVPHDYISVAIYNPTSQTLSHYPLQTTPEKLVTESRTVAAGGSAAGRALLEQEIKIFSRQDLIGIPSLFVNEQLAVGIQSLCCVPLITRKGELGTLNLGSKEKNAFRNSDFDLLRQIAAQVALALENARAYNEIDELKDEMAKERLFLEEEIHTELHFEEIVGESPALKQVLKQASTVAPSDANVLILGETGTGKELLAKAIHRMSNRKDAVFVKLNCAAIPTGLLESELFGHEKGAFTGAISQKVGRLELANRGTLFLDEVGDIPLELQPKLLRVLQDQEFERLGSNRTIRVDARLIAATNKDLVKSVADREFRSDLYYRINVFPIRMPALRERRTDIPLLVHYFVGNFARRMNKQISKIPGETMKALMAWSWPGNVRELENFLERSVILSEGPVLKVPLMELGSGEEDSSDGTLEGLEREHIIRVLRETRGVIAGAHGAAARLGLKRTTLQSKILRMGITRAEYR